MTPQELAQQIWKLCEYRGPVDAEAQIAALLAPHLKGEWLPVDQLTGKDGYWLVGHAAERWVCEAYWQSDLEQWFERNNDPTDSWGGAIFPTHGQSLPSAPEMET